MLNSSISPVDKALSDANTSRQSGAGSNTNVGLLHIFESPRTGASLSDG